jgi:3',5'-cyclic AMP phosphodiesterase CpdA
VSDEGTATGTADAAGAAPAASAHVRLRALVVSDLHAVTGPGSTRESWADMSVSNNPLAQLPAFLSHADDPIQADVMLCPGDLGHKADPAATDWAWDRVHDIAAAVGANHVIATAGNHDVDSRHQGASLDPRTKLKALQPPFPLPPDAKANEYWARSMTVVSEAGWRVVTLDSCFHHDATEEEHQRGRIQEPALDYLKRELAATGDGVRVNVLLCHHHPMPHTELDPDDRSVMHGGDRLIDVLDRDRYGRWLIVHGHKHFPWLRYAGGSSVSPVLLSAGSASVSLYEPLNTQVRNQIHLVEFDTACSDAVQLHLAGTFRSWTWAAGSGWMPSASGTDGLPGRGGFGYRADPADLARQIYDQHASMKRKTLRGVELLATEPRLEYLAPLDLECLAQTLRRDHGVLMRFYDDGTISETTAP